MMNNLGLIGADFLDKSARFILDEATSTTRKLLNESATDGDFLTKATLAFGDGFDTEKLEDLRQQWEAGDFKSLPPLEIRSAAEINGANGAFSANTNTIYLSQEYIAQNASNPQAITDVLLEEIGHFVDSKINVSDAPGDEGAIFSALAQGVQLDAPTLQALKVEDDTATITLDGQVIQIEQKNELDGRANVPILDFPKVLNNLDVPILNKLLDDRALEGWGWVWVDPNQKYQSVTGIVKENSIEDDIVRESGSFVTHSDFPAVHDSHDQNTHILVDPNPEYDKLLSVLNDPGEIEIEWETGIHPSEHSGDGANPIFPKWVWPSAGDHVWVNGSWIYDVGHGETGDDGILRFRSEIHPPRAFATMREQVVPMPGTGSVPVRVTATDLYIHGDGGYASEILNGGQNLLLTGGHSTRTSPIDVDFDFDILLPPKPSDTAQFTSSITDGPGNTVGIAPILTPDLANNKVHVHVPLGGSGISPDEVYARNIDVGWAFPTTDLHHLRVTLTKMDLHEDMDLDPGDGELTFSWLNVDKAGSSAWQRLSDFDIPTQAYGGLSVLGVTIIPAYDNTLNDYDDDHGLGNGELNFSGPTFDFYVADGQTVTIRAQAYDQDGLDNLFGNHSPFISQIPGYFAAYADLTNPGDNDLYDDLKLSLEAPGYHVGEFWFPNRQNDSQYEMRFRVEDIPLTPAEVDTPPVANANGPYTVPEGGSVILSSAGSSDPDGSIATFQWDFNYDGINFDVNATGASPTFFAAGQDGPSSPTIALRAIDNLGVATIATSTVNITNVAPTASITGDTFGVPGMPRNFTLSATDPSNADNAAGFTFNVAFGDGTSQTVPPSASPSVTHVYTAEGSDTVTVTATDKDGGTSAIASHTIEIKAAGILPDPTDPTKTALFVGGTLGDDQIYVIEQGETNIYDVFINGQSKGTFSPTGRIVVFGQDGNDRIGAPNSHLPVDIDGGTGNDYLQGGFSDDRLTGNDGDDTIEGQAGNDTLDGGEGNNILNAGEGNNTVTAGSGNDIVYAGAGNDTISTDGGNDQIYAGDGNNTVNAGEGNNKIYAGTGYDYISAGTGDDEIYAGDGGSTILADAGNNKVYAGSGYDYISAGVGDDEIYAGDGGSTIFAGAGNNKVYTGTGYDSVYAEDGNDLISVGDGGSTIRAGNGKNTIYAGTGDDEVYAGTGDDEIYVGEGNNYIDAGSGKNTISAGSGSDVIDTGAGDDTIYAGEGLNTVRAGDGNNKIYSGANNDFIFAGNGNDEIYAGEGQNYIDAGNGNNTIITEATSDIILAGNGNDLIYAGEGSNRISAGNGNNTIYAGAGSDEISTGSGNDLIYAGEGNNLISTGTGFDTVYAGSGFDRFSLSEGLGAVTIIGFQAGQDSFIGAGPLSFSISENNTFVSLSSSSDLLAIVKDVHLV